MIETSLNYWQLKIMKMSTFRFFQYPHLHFSLVKPHQTWILVIFFSPTAFVYFALPLHLKTKIILFFNQLKKTADTWKILFTEKYWNFFHSFQFWFSAKLPAMARSGALFCRKIKLKNFIDPETAGGCGVVPFLSAKDLFCQGVTPSA